MRASVTTNCFLLVLLPLTFHYCYCYEDDDDDDYYLPLLLRQLVLLLLRQRLQHFYSHAPLVTRARNPLFIVNPLVYNAHIMIIHERGDQHYRGVVVVRPRAPFTLDVNKKEPLLSLMSIKKNVVRPRAPFPLDVSKKETLLRLMSIKNNLT